MSLVASCDAEWEEDVQVPPGSTPATLLASVRKRCEGVVVGGAARGYVVPGTLTLRGCTSAMGCCNPGGTVAWRLAITARVVRPARGNVLRNARVLTRGIRWGTLLVATDDSVWVFTTVPTAEGVEVADVRLDTVLAHTGAAHVFALGTVVIPSA